MNEHIDPQLFHTHVNWAFKIMYWCCCVDWTQPAETPVVTVWSTPLFIRRQEGGDFLIYLPEWKRISLVPIILNYTLKAHTLISADPLSTCYLGKKKKYINRKPQTHWFECNKFSEEMKWLHTSTLCSVSVTEDFRLNINGFQGKTEQNKKETLAIGISLSPRSLKQSHSLWREQEANISWGLWLQKASLNFG